MLIVACMLYNVPVSNLVLFGHICFFYSILNSILSLLALTVIIHDIL